MYLQRGGAIYAWRVDHKLRSTSNVHTSNYKKLNVATQNKVVEGRP